MKIAFYAPLKPPTHANPSGDRLLARLFMQALEMAGHEVQLVSEYRSFDREGDLGNQQRIRAEAEVERRRICEALENRPPDLWFTYHVYHKAPDWIGPEICDRFGVPYVIAEASVSPTQAEGPWKSGYKRGIDCVRKADAIVAINIRDLECVEPYISSKAELLKLKPFLDLTSIPKAKPNPAHNKMKIGTVAMMRRGDKMKSWLELADILHGLQDSSWELHAIGDGVMKDEILTHLNRATDEHLILHGRLEGAELFQVLGGCDVFLWPGINEAFGMAYVEAQALGLPVIAGRYGGVAGVVAHGISGYLYRPGHIIEARAALSYFLTRPEALQSLGVQAADTVRRQNDISNAARKLDHLVKTLCAK